jgi:hypothetical protein
MTRGQEPSLPSSGGITPLLSTGSEDEGAFRLGYGFVDLVRRPTVRADQVTRKEMMTGVTDLDRRLAALGGRPVRRLLVRTGVEMEECQEVGGFRFYREPHGNAV